MKKNIVILAVSAGLCIGFISAGCAPKEVAKPRHNSQLPLSGKVRVEDPTVLPAPEESSLPAPIPGSGVSGMPAGRIITDDMKTCDPSKENQCGLIPRSGCLGCLQDGDGHVAVNNEAARKIMMPLKDKCMPEIQALMEKRKAEMEKKQKEGGSMSMDDMPKSSDESCEYNKAECLPSGQCALAKMTEEEMKKAMEQMRNIQEQMQKRQREGGANGGQPNAGRTQPWGATQPSMGGGEQPGAGRMQPWGAGRPQ